jgi:hypothetical protein
MSTQIQITPKSGLTVGTTPIASGTVGRVLFQGTGNVLQQSAKFTFDDTLLTLDGGTSTANASIFEIKGAGGQRGLRVWQDNSAKIGGNTNYFITKGVGSGGVTNNFYSSDSHFCFGGGDLTKGWVHIGVNDNNPQARLDVRAQGALSTDIAFRVRNSANTDNLAYIAGNGLAIIGVNASSSPTLIIDPSGSARATLRGGTNQSILLNSSGFNNLNGGSGGWDIEATGGQIRQRNGSNYTLLSGNFFGIGRTPSARLDVQAQGALSTDIALRVRNSADSANLFSVAGNGAFDFPTYFSSAQGGLGSEVRMGNAGTFYTQGNQLNITGSRIEVSASQAMLTTNSSQNISFTSSSGGATTQIMLNFFNGHLHLGGSNGNTLTGTNVLGIANGTAPTASFTDRYLQYSADIVAGNAAPHFRTENGSIIKLYKQDLPTNPTNAEIATLLSNLGLANLI